MDIAELHSRALDATRGVIAGIRQGQWAAPTPCQGWDVRALVNHVVAGNLWAAYGPVPGAVYAGHRFIDVLIHGWDVAVATSQETKLSPVLVDACLDIVAPQAELLRASGVFGDKIELPDASDAQTRLLATLGRRA